MRKILGFFFLLMVFASLKGFATHNRAGEITYRFLNGNTFEITITTYTKATNAADRDSLTVRFGDGNQANVQRNSAVIVGNDIKRNIYITTHSYPGPASYIISVEDPNRNGGIVNIQNSINVPFYIETKLVINPFLNSNSSVQLLNPPIDQGCINRLFVHNPNAFDPDGDSISYELVTPKGLDGLPINAYFLPNASTSLTLDPINGDLIWQNPVIQGEFNFAIKITEWRNGFEVGFVVRDLQVSITNCNNNPPIINELNDTCVLAGTNISRLIRATDPDGNSVTLTANGGPLSITNSPAVFPQPTSGIGAVQQTFNWQTNCTHVRKTPYQVIFRAVDNGNVPLTALRSWRITVVAPPVVNLTANSQGGTITLDWDQGFCTNNIGYKIYRRIGPSGWQPDSCETGVPAFTGYTLIDTVMGTNNTLYVDDNQGQGLSPGVDYCYIVTAFFSPFLNQPLGGAESIASIEVCEIVKRDLPVLTKADVVATANPNGQVMVNWAHAIDIDTTQFPGPYRYELYRNTGLVSNNNRTLLATFNSSFLNNWGDTTFLDQTANTVDNGNTYTLNFYFQTNQLVGRSTGASTVFLEVAATDSRLDLSWDYNVPWTNDSFVVYRKDPGAPNYEIVDTVYTQNYVDTGLINGFTYCYLVTSYGGFLSPGLPNFILNNSQEVCEFPRDTVPPCPPDLTVDPDCNLFQNLLNWSHLNEDCIGDLSYYKIYYQPFADKPFELIDSVFAPIRTYLHGNLLRSIAGCYAITSVDSSLNESEFSNIVCVDNCPEYTLPNVISPNNDGANDFFVPFPGYKFVDKIDLTVYNRWGQPVFQTTDPAINWNGNLNNGDQPVAGGIYYYICKVDFIRFTGIQQDVLKGSLTVIR